MIDIQQGDIYLANLSPIKGHEQAGYRPILVLQKNVLNQFLSTVVVAPLTSNLGAKGKLTTYFLEKEKTGFDQDSVVLLFQIRTLDKTRLTKKIAHIEVNEILAIKEQLNYVF